MRGLKKKALKYSEKSILYILTVLEAIEKISIYVEAFTNANDFFESNHQLSFNAVCHLLLAVGEESKKIELSLKEELGVINWEEIAGMRNRIAHDYRGIDKEIVFDIVQKDLPILRQALLAMLKMVEPNTEKLMSILSSEWYTHVRKLLV